jgi:iron(III) transport system ATP-binding protein
LLLNFGKIEQQGTPEEMYNRPQTQFTAEFMGSNNHLPGNVAQIAEGRALLAGDGWRLWGAARGSLAVGDAAIGVIRLERTRIASGAGTDCVKAELVTGMFLGDRKENLFKLGDLRLRCYGSVPAGNRECFLELPPEDLWVFAGNAPL